MPPIATLLEAETLPALRTAMELRAVGAYVIGREYDDFLAWMRTQQAEATVHFIWADGSSRRLFTMRIEGAMAVLSDPLGWPWDQRLAV